MSVTFKKVDHSVWLVYVGSDQWGKLWQSLPIGTWTLIDKNHRRYHLGQFLTPAKAKSEASSIICESHYSLN